MFFVKVDRASMMRQRSTGQEILSIRVVSLCFGHVIDLRKRYDKVYHHDRHRTVLTSEMRCVCYEDHNSAFLGVSYVMFEIALVDYVVPDLCQQTKYSHDDTLMRFCAFTVISK